MHVYIGPTSANLKFSRIIGFISWTASLSTKKRKTAKGLDPGPPGRTPLRSQATAMGDFLVPIAPLVVAGASTYPAFHVFREFAKVVLKPIEPPPSKTIPQLAQSTPSTPSTTLDDDSAWFPIPFFGTVQTPAFTPEPTPFVPQSMLPQAAAPVKNLDHLSDVLSSDPARVMMVFIVIVTFYLFIQFVARYMLLRRRFAPVTHIISTAITIYFYTLTGPASHYALLSMPVTLHQAKESALPIACATLAAFSIFNMLISVVESLFRNLLAGIEVSTVPNRVRHLSLHFLRLPLIIFRR